MQIPAKNNREREKVVTRNNREAAMKIIQRNTRTYRQKLLYCAGCRARNNKNLVLELECPSHDQLPSKL